MTGKQIKEKLKSIGVNLSELSKSLGFESSQRLHSALKTDDVRSGLIESIAKVIKKDVAWFYDTDSKSSQNDCDTVGLLHVINENLIEIKNILKKQ